MIPPKLSSNLDSHVGRALSAVLTYMYEKDPM